jgi:hypothetical protein
MPYRLTLAQRHLRAAGTLPRAQRKTCALAAWGDVRPAAASAIGRTGGNIDGKQRGRTGVRGAT